MGGVFDTLSAAYDRWYDTPEGEAVFAAERECLLALQGGPFGGWVEVGVGTGRFAAALGIPAGVDPSPGMLALARARGIQTVPAHSECLPFGENAFEGVLLALALCFVADPSRALQECRRITRPGGHLLIGTVPADSVWGREYRNKAARGHPIYAHAHFRTAQETIALVQSAGFVLLRTAGTLFWPPGGSSGQAPQIRFDCGEEAGFLSLLFQKPVA